MRHDGNWPPRIGRRGSSSAALAWLGPEEVEDSLDAVLPQLSERELNELAAARAVMPRRLAEPLSARLTNG